ncbi:hypothetical protein Tco_1392191 [Tanacetum coccineum]
MSISLRRCLNEMKQEVTKEVQKMLDIFKSMESEVDRTSKKNDILQNKIDQLLEANIANDVRNLIMQSYVEIKNKEECKRIFEIETESREKNNLFESKTCVLKIKIVELENTLAKQTKENSDLLMKIDNLENAFADEVKRVTTGKLTAFNKENCDFGSKVTYLEKITAQKTKDFDDVKLELSNRTSKFKAYFEKLENTKVDLERQLARKVDDSKAENDQFLKEINHLKTQLENMKRITMETKFDKPSILGKPHADKLLIASQLSKSWFTPKVVVQKDLSKPVTT